MSQQRDQQSRPPRKKWVTIVYRLLAAGRYAAMWLPELIILYEITLNEEGEEKAKDWLIKELSLSIKPSLALRLYRLVRVVYLAWEAYRKVARD